MPEVNPLISLTNLTVRKSGRIILSNNTFQLHSGECWAIIGATGSGKTTFLQALSGQIPVSPEMRFHRALTEFVSFKEESSRFSYSGYFYQQRFQATMSDNPATGDVGYRSIPTLRSFLQLTESPESIALLERLGLYNLIDRSFLKLSNGQTRKARIGKALLRHPDILLLDNPFVGLDVNFRLELIGWLGDLITSGLTLMVVTEPNDIPPFITHVVTLEAGRISWMGEKDTYQPKELIPLTQIDPPVLLTKPPPTDFTEAFQLRDVTVRYGNTIILNRVNWIVRAGERWALFGQNGAGKSVLLSLLYGDHPQAYANDVSVFGYRRGKAGESIWDVKRRIGFVSPELHLYFPQGLSVRQVALTGLTDTLTPPNRVSPESETDLTNLLSYFELTDLVNRPFGTLSAGEQRLILLIRAFLKNPPVLLLDEPFQVIDSRHIRLANQLINSLTDKTILFVTHNRSELPTIIDQVLTLDNSNNK